MPRTNGRAGRKAPRLYTVLGTSLPRIDLATKVTGEFEYIQNVRRPGMVHGKVVRPPVVGATVVSVDNSSVASMPGNVQVVVKKDFVGVVAARECPAIQGA